MFVCVLRQSPPARKQNAKFFRTLNISFPEGATQGSKIFSAYTGASRGNPASTGGSRRDRYGPDRNRQNAGVSRSGDRKAVWTEHGRHHRAGARPHEGTRDASGRTSQRTTRKTGPTSGPSGWRVTRRSTAGRYS